MYSMFVTITKCHINVTIAKMYNWRIYAGFYIRMIGKKIMLLYFTKDHELCF